MFPVFFFNRFSFSASITFFIVQQMAFCLVSLRNCRLLSPHDVFAVVVGSQTKLFPIQEKKIKIWKIEIWFVLCCSESKWNHVATTSLPIWAYKYSNNIMKERERESFRLTNKTKQKQHKKQIANDFLFCWWYLLFTCRSNINRSKSFRSGPEQTDGFEFRLMCDLTHLKVYFAPGGISWFAHMQALPERMW